jgi:type VI secretion system protein ImpH
MADQGRAQARALDLWQALEIAPYHFDFYQALRRVECTHPSRPRLGEAQRPGEEPIRLTQDPSLAFAPAALAGFDRAGAVPRLAVSFLGLLGPNGPLPLHLTEYARDRLRNSGDPTFARFLDVFHHRMLTLFYRAWADAQPTVSHDRPDSDRFAVYVGSLFGLGMTAFRDRDVIPDRAKLGFAGRFALQTHNAEGLEALISTFFRMPAEIEEFVGDWIDIPQDYRWSIGTSPETGQLGVSASLGARTWQRQHKFRVVLGPLDQLQFARMLPGGHSLPALIDLIRNYTGDELSWDLRLRLREGRPFRLGGDTRLGWSAWLGRRSAGSGARDVVFDPLSRAAVDGTSATQEPSYV